MTERLIDAQELYDRTFAEALERTNAKGLPPPDQTTVFKTLVKATKEAIANGEAPPEFLKELEKVQPAKMVIKRESSIIQSI